MLNWKLFSSLRTPLFPTEEIHNRGNAVYQSVVESADQWIFVEEMLLAHGKRFNVSRAQIVNSAGIVGRGIAHLNEARLALLLLVIIPCGTFFTPKTGLCENGLVEEFYRSAVTAACVEKRGSLS